MMNPWLAIALVLGIFAAQTIALRAFHKSSVTFFL